MTNTQLQLVRVVVQGPDMPRSASTFGGVQYLREPAGKNAIYTALRLPSRRCDLGYPVRDDEQLKVTVLRLPFGKTANVEFCGAFVDLVVAAAAQATNDAEAVGTLKPLLGYLQENFQVV